MILDPISGMTMMAEGWYFIYQYKDEALYCQFFVLLKPYLGKGDFLLHIFFLTLFFIRQMENTENI